MKRILYIIYIMVATLAVTLIGGCEEQVFEYDFINNAGEEPAPTPTPTPGVNAKNVIYYTSTDGKVVTPHKTDVFGANIVSNVYENGKGTITFSGTVTKIGDNAFYGCTKLTSVTIPNSVTSIGNDAFNDCTSLKSVTIPNSVTSIGYDAFFNCSALTSATIPNNVTSIGSLAFGNCTSLKSVTIPDSVTEIGPAPFRGCTSLKGIYGKFASEDNHCLIVDGVLNSFAPAGLTSYIIPNSVTSIGDWVFFGCTSLTSVTIPNSVTSIGSLAFSYCSQLAGVYCKPTTPPTLGGPTVFDDNASDRKIYVPSASVNAYKTATNWSRYADQIVAEGSSDPSTATNVIEYTSSDGKVVTPYKTDVFGVNIVSNVYENGKGVITFDGPVTKIGNEAFRDCTTLASITIPDSVTEIGTTLFSRCTSLKSFYGKFASEDNRCLIINGELKSFAPAGLTSYIIPNSVTSIGTYAFYYCSGLTSVTIPNSVTSIGTYAFGYCSDLTSVTIPNSVTSIGSYAFRSCTSLSSVTIPDSVTSIGGHAFFGCSKLAEVYCKPTTPPTLGGSSVFDSNASDRKIYVPSASVDAYKTATNWSEYASQIVAEGSSTTEYVIEYTSTDGAIVTPNTNADFGANIVSNVYENGKGVITFDGPVTTIGAKAFYNCLTLASFTIPNSVTSIGNNAFRSCTLLTSVTIPESVTSIGDYAFRNCTSLTSVTIPESVTSIGNYAFYDCTSLTSVTIPNSVTSIGNYAFYSCSKLAEVYCKPTTPPTLGGSYVFDNNATDRKIYVPSASVDAYKTATNWSEYADQIVADPSSTSSTYYVEDAACGLSMKMIWVEGGTFTMGATAEQGSDPYDDEKPAHSVTVSSYYIAECEVTQAQWKKIMGTTINDLAASSSLKGVGDNYPIYYVTYDEAKEFCSKLSALTGKNYSLPTEAQWEYAARGGKYSKGYKYSGSSTIDEVSWYGSNSGSTAHPVKQKKANELGLYDMSGNIYEWCSDWWTSSYSSGSQIDPTGAATGTLRAKRGGSWVHGQTSSRVSDRGSYTPSSRSNDGGFRVVCK